MICRFMNYQTVIPDLKDAAFLKAAQLVSEKSVSCSSIPALWHKHLLLDYLDLSKKTIFTNIVQVKYFKQVKFNFKTLKHETAQR